MAKPRIAFVVGTRPDAIKSAPVILEFGRFEEGCEPIVISTGQHREMLEQVFETFGFHPAIDLKVMQHGQSLSGITAKVIEGLENAFEETRPDYVIAQGDTSTTFAASLVAFYRRIPFGHIEAGLRTDTIDNPFPEEFNRRATGLIATHHFPPTAWAAQNLLNEGHSPESVFVTGNTGIDAVLRVARSPQKGWFEDFPGRVVLLTTHRRENWGEPQRNIAKAAKRIVEKFEDVLIVAPMHRNPAVRETLSSVLEGVPRVELIEPPEYAQFVKLMQRSSLILSDSGGVQEEAPAFGIPVLVLRDTTERPEGVEAGTAKLIGVDQEAIFSVASSLLEDPAAYKQMANAVTPYGDGHAAKRIRSVVFKALGIETDEVAMWG